MWHINALYAAGFVVERMVEQTDDTVLEEAAVYSEKFYSQHKAQHIPLSFVIKAKKL